MSDDNKAAASGSTNDSTGEQHGARNDVVVKIGLVGDAQVVFSITTFASQ
jgi:hypothetical protein